MKVSVYLASSCGNDPIFSENAFRLGCLLAEAGFEVVYGGADVGCMKALADGVCSVNGHLTGIFPEGFKGRPEYAHNGVAVRRSDLSWMIPTSDFMHRKKLMEEMGDCSVVLPGSWGTFDEMFTYLADRALRFHLKPVFVLNLGGFYDPVRTLLENARRSGFITDEYQADLQFFPDVESLMVALKTFADNNINK